MRLLTLILLSALCSSAALPQTKHLLRLKSVLKVAESGESVLAYRLVDGESKLVLAGSKSVRVLDLTTAAFTESYTINIPELSENKPRVISPDGRRMIVFGNYSFTDKKNKVKRQAAVWDLRTGMRIAVLDKLTKPVRAAFWSRNGKTLATSSDKYAPDFVDSASVEIAFWDGETISLQNVLPSDKVNWWYLTSDGSECFYSTAGITNLFFLDRFIGYRGGPISLWDTRSGVLETTLPVSSARSLTRTRGISVSADERFLGYLAENPKGKKSEARVVVWEVQPSQGSRRQLTIRHEIPPGQKLPEHGVSFTPDGSCFTFHADGRSQIYETRTGQLKFEWRDDFADRHWLNGNTTLLSDKRSWMEARDVATGKQLYKHKIVYVVSEYTEGGTPDDIFSGNTVRTVDDETKIIPHPDRELFLTFSRQYVRVYEARTGLLLQTLVEPPIDSSKPPDPKKGPRLSRTPLIWKADWSADGNVLYFINADRNTISIWEI